MAVLLILTSSIVSISRKVLSSAAPLRRLLHLHRVLRLAPCRRQRCRHRVAIVAVSLVVQRRCHQLLQSLCRHLRLPRLHQSRQRHLLPLRLLLLHLWLLTMALLQQLHLRAVRCVCSSCLLSLQQHQELGQQQPLLHRNRLSSVLRVASVCTLHALALQLVPAAVLQLEWPLTLRLPARLLS